MPAGYEVPPILGVALAIFWGLLSEPQRSQESPFFTNDPPTYTYCKEAIGVYQSIVGGFIPDRGLRVDRTIEFGTEDVGIAGWQEFWY